MHAVALEADADPDRPQFHPAALRAARRTTASHPAFPPQALAEAHHKARDEILSGLRPERRPRAAPCRWSSAR